MLSLLEQDIEGVPGLQKGHKAFQGSSAIAGLQTLLWKHTITLLSAEPLTLTRR